MTPVQLCCSRRLTSASLVTVCCCKVRVSWPCSPGSCWHSTCRRHNVSHSFYRHSNNRTKTQRQKPCQECFCLCFLTAASYLCDGKGLLLGVLTEADHKQDLRGEEQTASMLLTWTTHNGHLQGHMELRPAQRLQHLPAVIEGNREGCMLKPTYAITLII